MKLRCVIGGTNANGSADFTFVIVNCTEEEYDLGEHYDAATNWALHDQTFEYPVLVWDEREAPAWLLERFVWESATTINTQGVPV